jgi:hypothetical protein
VIGSYKPGVDSQISNSANDEYLGRWLRGRIGIRRELKIGERLVSEVSCLPAFGNYRTEIRVTSVTKFGVKCNHKLFSSVL